MLIATMTPTFSLLVIVIFRFHIIFHGMMDRVISMAPEKAG